MKSSTFRFGHPAPRCSQSAVHHSTCPENDDKFPRKRRHGGSSEEKRADCVEESIRVVRSKYGADIYSAIRLAAPELDLDNGPTGVKERVMAKILPQALSGPRAAPASATPH